MDDSLDFPVGAQYWRAAPLKSPHGLEEDGRQASEREISKRKRIGIGVLAAESRKSRGKGIGGMDHMEQETNALAVSLNLKPIVPG